MSLLSFPFSGRHTVDVAGVVRNDLLDHTLLLQVVEGLACERAVDLQSVDEDGDGDQAVGLDIFLKLLVGLLVEDDGVLGLVLHCTAIILAGVLYPFVEWRWYCVCASMSLPIGVRDGELAHTLALGPLLLLLLASGCCWCLFKFVSPPVTKITARA